MIGKFIRASPKRRQLIRNIKMYFFRYRFGLKKVDPTFYMGGSSRVSKDFIAGPYSFMNYGCDICPRVEVGAYVMFAPQVIITGSDHDPNQPGVPMYFTKRPHLPKTIIEDDVWIGCRTVIMAGVKIGKGSVIGAGAVVTRDVKAYTIVAGVPASFIRNRFENEEDIKKHELSLAENKVWNYSDPIDWS
jgi:acetyltransferase-like isoleucine patch superfamily enzyme